MSRKKSTAGAQVAILDGTPPPGLPIGFAFPRSNVPSGGGPPGPAGFGAYHDDFIATLNQMTFDLSAPPNEPELVFAVVDGMSFYAPANLTVTGQIVTWLPATTFFLEAGQHVRIYYT